jgi:signal transduction protein with GAF and PtsI domain
MENNETNKGLDTQTSAVDTQNTQNADYEAEIKKLKEALSKSNSENADWKRKYNSKLTEEEQSKALQEERDAYIKSLEQKVAKTELSAELSKGVSDSKVVDGVVDDLINGNHSEAIKKINKYIEDRVANAIKEHDAELLRSNPVPPPTAATGGITKEQFDNMTVAERSELFENDRETYNKLINQ